MRGKPVLVRGATGTIGSQMVDKLLACGSAVRVLTRDRAKAARFSGAVEIVVGELARPETLEAAERN